MARNVERIVSEIRLRRGPTIEHVRALGSMDEIERRIRRAPVAWLLGGALAGVVAARFFGPQLARAGRRRVLGWAAERARGALFGLAAAAVAGRSRSRKPEPVLGRKET